MIDIKKLNEMFLDSLFRDKEVVEGKPTTDPVLVIGIVQKVGFHKERLNSHKQEVIDLLDQLPDDFQPEKGGGTSFLNMCVDKDGAQWGEHRNMEQLCMMAIGLGLADWCMPREMWNVLPGGMPYFGIKKREVLEVK
jgi:hypothetical protein